MYVRRTSVASPRGLVVKFNAFCFASPGSVPGCGPIPLIYQWPCCGGGSHTKRGRLARDVTLGQIFLSKKEEDWQQMLTQGESSSGEKKNLPPKSPSLNAFIGELHFRKK